MTIDLTETEDSIVLQISDDGVGLEEQGGDHLPHLGMELMRQRLAERDGYFGTRVR